MARTATARATARTTRTSPRRARTRSGADRCAHGLLRGTCAICLQMEETTDDLNPGRLAPDERPRGAHSDEGESEEGPEEKE